MGDAYSPEARILGHRVDRLSMDARNVVSRWASEAAQHARIDQLSNGRWYGEVPGCAGVIATAATRDAVERELLSVLEEWALLGLELEDEIPVYGETDLNSEDAGRLARRSS